MANFEQMAKDLQKIISNAVDCSVYETEPPRDKDGAITVKPPFVIYGFTPNSPQDEAGEYQIDVFVDVWALNGWASCYRVAMLVDDALNEVRYNMASGALVCHQNGAIMQRNERDPVDERIRRMSGQYLIRWNSKEV